MMPVTWLIRGFCLSEVGAAATEGVRTDGSLSAERLHGQQTAGSHGRRRGGRHQRRKRTTQTAYEGVINVINSLSLTIFSMNSFFLCVFGLVKVEGVQIKGGENKFNYFIKCPFVLRGPWWRALDQSCWSCSRPVAVQNIQQEKRRGTGNDSMMLYRTRRRRHDQPRREASGGGEDGQTEVWTLKPRNVFIFSLFSGSGRRDLEAS